MVELLASRGPACRMVKFATLVLWCNVCPLTEEGPNDEPHWIHQRKTVLQFIWISYARMGAVPFRWGQPKKHHIYVYKPTNNFWNAWKWHFSFSCLKVHLDLRFKNFYCILHIRTNINIIVDIFSQLLILWFRLRSTKDFL